MFYLHQLLTDLGKVGLPGNYQEGQEFFYYTVNIFLPDTDIADHTLYLVDGFSVPELLAGRKHVGCVLLRGTDNAEAETRGNLLCEWVCWDEHINLMRLMNQIQTAINQDAEGDENRRFFSDALNSSISIASFVHQASEMAQNPIMVTDPTFHLIASDACGCTVEDLFWQEIHRDGCLSPESVQLLKESGVTDLTEYAIGPVLYNATNVDMNVVKIPRAAAKLYSPQGEFLGTVAVYEVRRKLSNNDLLFVRQFGKALSVKLRYQPYTSKEQEQTAELLRHLLEGAKVGDYPASVIKNCEKVLKQKQFRLCLVQLARDRALSRQGEYFRTYLFSDIDGVFSWRYHTDILALLYTDSNDKLASTLGMLRSRISKFPLIMGVSRCFHSPNNMAEALAEAGEAISLGERFAAGEKLFCYEDVDIFRLISCLTREQMAAYYNGTIHRYLRLYDEEHDADFCHTLETFALYGGNNIRTAEVLHIHKNTLFYRLNKISSLTGLNLNQEKTLHDFYLSSVIHHCLRVNHAQTDTR